MLPQFAGGGPEVCLKNAFLDAADAPAPQPGGTRQSVSAPLDLGWGPIGAPPPTPQSEVKKIELDTLMSDFRTDCSAKRPSTNSAIGEGDAIIRTCSGSLVPGAELLATMQG